MGGTERENPHQWIKRPKGLGQTFLYCAWPHPLTKAQQVKLIVPVVLAPLPKYLAEVSVSRDVSEPP